MKTRLSTCFFFVVLFNHFHGQINSEFINHLAINNLIAEHRLYLASFPQQTDSVHYFQAKFNAKYFNDSLFLFHYFKSKTLCNNDSALIENMSAAFLTKSKPMNTEKWFKTLHTCDNGENVKELIEVYNCSLDPNKFPIENFQGQTDISFMSYRKAFNKKPLVAAALSVFIPGLGKLYAGKTRAFFTTLILNAAYAAQTIESNRKLGATSALTIINAVGFTTFYVSNIYGSFKAVQQRKKEFKKQFLVDATLNYN